jgi:hypothetical protein
LDNKSDHNNARINHNWNTAANHMASSPPTIIITSNHSIPITSSILGSYRPHQLIFSRGPTIKDFRALRRAFSNSFNSAHYNYANDKDKGAYRRYYRNVSGVIRSLTFTSGQKGFDDEQRIRSTQHAQQLLTLLTLPTTSTGNSMVKTNSSNIIHDEDDVMARRLLSLSIATCVQMESTRQPQISTELHQALTDVINAIATYATSLLSLSLDGTT